ncbi:uridine diphosphate glucose pyrophosphatase NUDT14-like [Belonocnema kinseyi]|uniref:uridine diphosphate glucose pyrophosphatase NUDT14-like n=1 Tax=Belonocnema kinseyi TaxID=2817044 RepID=UPI00143DD545|nr:uridine diphosphate glucose pyrophosphatase NUDT14-like [Belonocnema kinseyi]
MCEKSQEERNTEIRKKMLDLEEVEIGPVPDDSPWIKTIRVSYLQDKTLKSWDMMMSHEGVAIIVFNTTRKKLIFVRQLRPAYYIAALPESDRNSSKVDVKKYPATLGLTLELCAGMVDKDKSTVEIAVDELREECGYEAPPSAFEKISTYRSSVVSSTSGQTLFYVEVTDEMQKHKGGGEDSEGELIEIVEMSVEEAKSYANSGEVQSLTFLYGVTWFLLNKQNRYL